MSDDVAVAMIGEAGPVILTLILLLALWLFREPIRALVPRLRHVKVAGIELQLAGEALREDRGDRLQDPGVVETLVARAARMSESLTNFRILWVDDNPANNEVERRFLRQAGATVLNALSTDEAMRELRRDDFDVVITDFLRDGSPTAGLEMAALMFDEGYRLPVLAYVGEADPHRSAPHIRTVTDHPDVLISRVLDIARARRP